jgi:hypothetical protein
MSGEADTLMLDLVREERRAIRAGMSRGFGELRTAVGAQGVRLTGAAGYVAGLERRAHAPEGDTE